MDVTPGGYPVSMKTDYAEGGGGLWLWVQSPLQGSFQRPGVPGVRGRLRRRASPLAIFSTLLAELRKSGKPAPGCVPGNQWLPEGNVESRRDDQTIARGEAQARCHHKMLHSEKFKSRRDDPAIARGSRSSSTRRSPLANICRPFGTRTIHQAFGAEIIEWCLGTG